MRVNPSNQTLILASAPRGVGNASHAADTPSAVANRGPVLQRVTIVAAQPNTTLLYLRADYADPGSTETAAAALYTGTPLQRIPRATPPAEGRLEPPAVSTSRAPTGLSAHLTPVEQYARTQGIFSEPALSRYIDVHA